MQTRIALENPMPYVALARGDDCYVFRYEKGNEAELLSTLMDYAEDADLNFTWLDVLLILRGLKV